MRAGNGNGTGNLAGGWCVRAGKGAPAGGKHLTPRMNRGGGQPGPQNSGGEQGDPAILRVSDDGDAHLLGDRRVAAPLLFLLPVGDVDGDPGQLVDHPLRHLR